MNPKSIVKCDRLDINKLYMQDKFTLKETAVILNLASETISRLLTSKRLKGTKGAKNWTIKKEDIETYIKDNNLDISFGYEVNIKNLKNTVNILYEKANYRNNKELKEIAEKLIELTEKASDVINE